MIDTVLVIEWLDACSEEASEPQHIRPVVPTLSRLRTVGFLLAENEEAITLGMELDPSDGTKPGRWRIHIPKGQVVTRTELAAAPARRKRKCK